MTGNRPAAPGSGTVTEKLPTTGLFGLDFATAFLLEEDAKDGTCKPKQAKDGHMTNIII